MQESRNDSKCPKCSERISFESAFCGKCGHSLYGIAAHSVTQEDLNTPAVLTNWQQLKQLITLYGILLCTSLILGLTSRELEKPILEIYYWAFVFVIVLFYLNRTWNITKASFNPRPATTKVLIEIVLATSAAYWFVSFYFSVFQLLGLKSVGLSELYLKAGWPIWSIFVMISVLPGLFEEIIFRGILQTNLAKLTSENEALIIQAALFSILHLLPTIFISHFVMGLLVGWIRMRMGHIYYGVLLHMVWNSFVILNEFKKI